MPQALALVSVIRYHAKQPKTYFDRFVVSFPALKECFNQGCRPFLGIDDCHLKGPYKGVLLSVVAIDANDGIFPITFCKGIQNALALEFPNAHVRYCARHILANLKAKHPLSDFKLHFWAAARASNRIAFDRVMEELRKTDEGVYETLRKLPAKFWSRHAFDNNCKSDHCTNNSKDQADFLSPWLKKDTYIRGYSGMIHPILDKDSWLNPGRDEILPSLMKRPLGRPKINIRMEVDEVPPESKRYRLQSKCCKEFGHNKRGCPANPENLNKRTRLYQTSDNIQVTVEVEDIRTYNLRNSKKHKTATQAGPSASKNLVKKKRIEGSSDAAWVGVQGKKIITDAGIDPREDYRRDEHKAKKKLDKGKASAFPP
ncbi:hypothetical protein WN944_018277 [Citrus x changshan-huyou]|uniref:Transposase n=1 Tax=Citrus x changshan-huyou TaxID=2935761 RepID=A0AAP0QEM2_9ROSI